MIADPRKPGCATLFCFSHLRWNFVFQRPNHLMQRAACGANVLYIEEPQHSPTGELHFHEVAGDGVRRLIPQIPRGESAIAGQRKLVEDLLRRTPGRKIGWFYTPLALRFLELKRFDLTVYDCMDDLTGFAGADPAIRALEDRLLDAADVVFTGGRSLFARLLPRRADALLEPSSVDVAHFARARGWTEAPPPDQAAIPGPRLGWFGVIDERMNLPLLAQAAALRPDWRFIMLGPTAKIDPAALPRLGNIHWLGPKEYAALPGYLAGWDCGIMPFALNAATAHISPTKTPEYLAAGTPVVSTPVRDVAQPWGEAGLVAIGADAASFVQAAQAAMARPRAPWLAAVDAAMADLSWDRTWARMAAALADAARAKPNRRSWA